MKRIAGVSFLILAALPFSPVPAGEPVKAGYIGPLTGKAALFGIAGRNGITKDRLCRGAGAQHPGL